MADLRHVDELLRAANPVRDDREAMRVVRETDPLWQTIRTRLDADAVESAEAPRFERATNEETVMETVTRSRRTFAAAVAAAAVLAVVAALGAQALRGRAPDVVAPGPAGEAEPAANAADEPEADAAVVFDGTDCASTLPARWPAETPLRVEITNRSDTAFGFELGTYDEGYDHADLVAQARESSARPYWASLRFQVSVFGGEQQSFIVSDQGTKRPLEPGRYYAVCWQTGSDTVVLPDLVLEGS